MTVHHEPVPFIEHVVSRARFIGLSIASDLIIQILDDALLERRDHAYVRKHVFDCYSRTEQIVRTWGGSEEISEMPNEIVDLMVRHCKEGLLDYLKSLDKHIGGKDVQS